MSAPAEGRIQSGRLAGKTLREAIWILSWPVMLQQFMLAGVGFVDKLLAGNLPSSISVAALDGVGVGTYVGWFMGIALGGLGIGGQAIIARAMGAGRPAEGDAALGAAMTLSVLWGALMAAALWFAAAPLAWLASLSPEATGYCITYVRVSAISMPAAGILTVGGLCLHGAGETKAASVISMVVNATNLVLAWLLSGVEVRLGGVALPHPLPIDPERWGVLGIAAGGSLSSVVGAVLTMRVLFRGVRDLRLHRAALKPPAHLSWRIARVGIPTFMEGIAMWSVSLFVMSFIGMAAQHGDDGLHAGLVGAHTIAVQWESFSFLPGYAMGTAAGALAGQALGAGNPLMARRAIWVCTGIGILIMGSMGILFMTEGRLLTSIISTQPVHLEQVPPLLFLAGLAQPFFALSMTVRQGLRGAGDSMWILVLTFISTWLIRLPAAWFLGVHLQLGLRGIWMGLCGELVIRGMLYLGRFSTHAWEKVRV